MDSLCLGTGIHGISSSILMGSNLDILPGRSQFTASVGNFPAPANGISVETGSDKAARSRFLFKLPFLRSLFPGGKQRMKGVALDDAVLVESKERQDVGNGEEGGSNLGQSERRNGNWVLKILMAKEEQGKGEGGDDEGQESEEREREENGELGDQKIESSSSGCHDEEAGACKACDEDDAGENAVVFDRDSFSRMLKKVSFAEAKLYAQLSYLSLLAYSIPSIKPGNLLKRQGLRYVTSSVEKREQFSSVLAEGKEQLGDPETDLSSTESDKTENNRVGRLECEDRENEGYRISASAAFQIAASAASYLHTRTRSILPFRSSNDATGDVVPNNSGRDDDGGMDLEMAAFMATTDSVTAVVAAKEEVKQAVADDLNSISSTPCEWYICDDDKSATRFFVIQGSESLASWQANLLFEPVQFEGSGVFVHRGIYEAAKGMYQQMLPEIHVHTESHGGRAKFRFTGHSLGGSLSLLINLMLLMRGELPPSSLLPVIMFGSPCVMCGGDDLLSKLGLPRSHVQGITMHRDIVPRAFSCNYPRHVAELLKAVNGNFRSHPCLNHQKLLYAPMGELLILQPEANYSPPHDLLPSGSGLYLLCCTLADIKEADKQLRAAKDVFLNTPHPLEILSDRSAYGYSGAITRDHDINSYLKCMRNMICQELNRIRKAKRDRRQKAWWALLVPRVINPDATVDNPSGSGLGTADLDEFHFSGIIRIGSKSLKRLSRFVASQRVHLLLLLIPAQLLLVGTFSMIG
ncbi:hypothetical protein Nepgr_022743 [Nepenthes gracilis]|uniref:Fungal lipase-type domain-containing protein n=1 Tax=Nepenthes gracilis TaxID=150966 RepID=A0AAD3T360_NEPGR|nr:hypothetical protein Nepgr_022743 [Nepenthes gracilis]